MIGRKVKLLEDDKIYTVVDKIKILERYNYDHDGYILMDDTGALFFEKYTVLERIVKADPITIPKETTNKGLEDCGPPMPKKCYQSYVEGEGGWVGPPPRNEFC